MIYIVYNIILYVETKEIVQDLYFKLRKKMRFMRKTRGSTLSSYKGQIYLIVATGVYFVILNAINIF